MSKCGSHQAVICSVCLLVIGVVIIIFGVIFTAGSGYKYQTMIIIGSSISAFGLLFLIVCIAVNNLPTERVSGKTMGVQNHGVRSYINGKHRFKRVSLHVNDEDMLTPSAVKRCNNSDLNQEGPRSPNLQVHIQLSPAVAIRHDIRSTSIPSISDSQGHLLAGSNDYYYRRRAPSVGQLGIGTSTSNRNSLTSSPDITIHRRHSACSEQQCYVNSMASPIPFYSDHNRTSPLPSQSLFSDPSHLKTDISEKSRNKLSVHNSRTGSASSLVGSRSGGQALPVSSATGSKTHLRSLTGSRSSGLGFDSEARKGSSHAATSGLGRNLLHSVSFNSRTDFPSDTHTNIRISSSTSFSRNKRPDQGDNVGDINLPGYSSIVPSTCDNENNTPHTIEELGPPPSYESVVKGPSLFHTSV